MASSHSESILNGVLIQMARGFLQYVAESWPWVDEAHGAVRDEVEVLAARQRQDVSLVANLLLEREWPTDFGSFPTEYTDMHFISLQAMLDGLKHSQGVIQGRLDSAMRTLREAGDTEAIELLNQVAIHEGEIRKALGDVQQQFSAPSAATSASA
ncbi:MAG: hypothetical protein R3C19_17920 [Planctomycetaceae bacterium]